MNDNRKTLHGCLDHLKGLPAYDQARKNLRQDLQTPDAPHGNVREERAEKLAEALKDHCAGFSADLSAPDAMPDDAARDAVLDTLAAHRTARQPRLAEHARVPASDAPAELRRVLSLTSFMNYHLLSGGADALTNAGEHKDSLKKKTGSVRYRIRRLRGATGRPGESSWWTFQERDGRPAPEDGERYMRELALLDKEITAATTDGLAVEAVLPREILGESLYKPCALDGFIPNTPFRPELTGAPFGCTVPTDPALTGRPEVISRSVAYQDMAPDDHKREITVHLLPMPGEKTIP